MFSEAERQELKEAAASPILRRDFQMLRDFSTRAGQTCPLEHYLDFLTCLSRLATAPPPPPFPLYTNIRL
jgi:hypothetical protein